MRWPLVQIIKFVGIATWLIAASGGVLLSSEQHVREMFAYSFMLPILLASFFYGQSGGLLVALLASMVSGSMALGNREVLQSPLIQRVLFQIILFNVVTLVTSGLAERERAATAEKSRLYQHSLELLADLQRARDELAQLNVELERKVQERTAELVQRVEQLDLINRVGKTIISLLDLDQLLQRTTQLIRDSFDYYAVEIYLVDRAANELRLSAAAADTSVNLPAHELRFPIDQTSMTGYAALTGEPAVADDVSADPRFRYDAWLPLTRSELALPLRSGDEIFGVLNLESTMLHAFDPQDVQVLQTLADQIAVAIHNARLYQAEARARRTADTLREMGQLVSSTLELNEVLERILSSLRAVVEYDSAAIMMLQDDVLYVQAGQGFSDMSNIKGFRLPLAEYALNREVIETGQPLIINDVRLDPRWRGNNLSGAGPIRSWMGVPLIASGKALGMLAIDNYTPHAYSRQDAQAAAAFAAQAAIALENASLYDEIGQFNEQLEQMVFERTQELRKAYATLEKMDRAKSDFIDIAAHELRTPLTLIRGYARLLADITANSPEARMYAEGILAGEARLYEIVNSLLDVSKITSQALEVCKEPVRLANIIENIHGGLKAALKERQLTFTTSGLDSLPTLQADPALLHKVFYHLIINAIKYTPDGGAITVSGRELMFPDKTDTAAVEVVVSDTGIGIDPAYQELIFEKFFQTGKVTFHSSGRTKFKGGGPGLGLPIAKGIVLAHGGKIWVESEGYDEERCPGSHFHVCLPLG